MMKPLIKLFLCLVASVSITAAATETPVKNVTDLVMGGTLKGIRNNSKSDAEITFKNAVSEVLKPYNISLKIIIYRSTDELKAAFDNNEIQGMFGSPLEYMQFEGKLVPQMAMRYRGVALKQPLLVIVKNKDASLKDFKGKKISLSNFQDLEELYLNTLLLKQKLPEVNDFFSTRLDVKNANVALMDVFFNRSDLTIIRENEYKTAVELNPQLAKKLHILNRSPGYITLIGASSQSSAEDVKEVIKGMESLSQSKKGVRMLRLVNADGLVKVSKKDLKEIFDLVNEYKNLKQQPLN